MKTNDLYKFTSNYYSGLEFAKEHIMTTLGLKVKALNFKCLSVLISCMDIEISLWLQCQ